MTAITTNPGDTTIAAVTTLPTARPRPVGPRPRRIIADGIARARFEVTSYFRPVDTLFFTFLFPVIMLAIFATAFSSAGEINAAPGEAGVTLAGYYLPGMLAAGMLLSGTQNLAVDIAVEKSDGTLKRLGGTPLSPVSYFIGKIASVFLTGSLQAALLLLVAGVVFGVDLPADASSWLTFGWVFVLGTITSTLVGIGLSGLPRSGKSASAVVIPVVLVLQFISGVYLQFTALPDWLQNFASVFPLKWMAQGMRAVFLPESFATLEQTGAWDLGWVAVALLVWLVVGLVVSRLTFRWIRRDA